MRFGTRPRTNRRGPPPDENSSNRSDGSTLKRSVTDGLSIGQAAASLTQDVAISLISDGSDTPAFTFDPSKVTPMLPGSGTSIVTSGERADMPSIERDS